MGARQQIGQLGLFRPESSWERPAELPDLRGRPLVAIDSETKDDGLAGSRGPGWALGPAGRILGVSWAAEGSVGYAPVSHPETENFPLGQVMRWLDDLFRSGTRIVFHNGPYDLGWLGTEGVEPPVLMEDTLPGCVMLDENHRSYDLDACCARVGIPGKDDALLIEAIRAYGGAPRAGSKSRRWWKEHIWRVPARFAAPYAEQDGVATLGLWHQIEPALRTQGVWDAYRTEIDLIPMTVAMRRRGIRVDEAAAEKTIVGFRRQSAVFLREIGELVGLRRPATMEEIRSPQVMERWFTAADIRFPRTAKSKQGSFSKEWMEKHEHPLARACVGASEYEDAASKFVENFILSFATRGRIHAEIHQFRSDDGGTRSHRLSLSEPPLQQMTRPDEKDQSGIGNQVRRLFLPEKKTAWLAADYSQQEPRLTVHFAALCRARGSAAAVQRYIENPKTDYHTMVAEMTGRPRPIAKILNLAMTYGKGKHSLAEELGVSLAEAEAILKDYHERMPFIKSLEETCKNAASSRGYIRLIDGARMHYSLWEGGWMEYEERQAAVAAGKRLDPCSLEEARERQKDEDHPWSRTRLRRADTRKSLNNLIQGSAARQTKRAMLAMWKEGILPLLQMHDELDVPVSEPEQVRRVGEIMVETTPLLVPTIVDLEVGLTWGQAKTPYQEFDWSQLREAA